MGFSGVTQLMHRAPIFTLCWRNKTSVLIEGEKKLHSFTYTLVWSFSSRQFHLSPPTPAVEPVVNEFYDENQFAVSTQIKIDNHRDSSARSSVVHNIWKIHVSLCHNRIRAMIIKFIWFPLRLITNNTRLFRLHEKTKVLCMFHRLSSTMFFWHFSYHYFLLRFLLTIQHFCSMQSTLVITFPLNVITCLLNFYFNLFHFICVSFLGLFALYDFW